VSGGGEHGVRLQAVRLGVDTRHEPVLFLRRDSEVARSEGFQAMSQVRVDTGTASIIATLMIVESGLLRAGQAGLSEAAWRRLGLADGETLVLHHPRPVESLAHVRAKVYGAELDAGQFERIIDDVVAGRYMDVQLAAFVAACSGERLTREEIVHLTRAMVRAGERLTWPGSPIMDKHSVGGLPGNRTTPIVVAIAAEAGLTMPKTSSRAITSPAGTADTMETLTRVDLGLDEMRRVVESEGACLAWGGSASLSPADDILIRVERALDLDSEGQLVASVLSKKVAAGSTHVVIDMPVGPTAKVRSLAAAERLSGHFHAVAGTLGLALHIDVGDGSQPIGRGIGPALEARDVLSVLRGEPDAPADLRQRALQLAAGILRLSGRARAEDAVARATELLDSGRAWTRFQRICEAQGGLREPPRAAYHYDVFSEHEGVVDAVDNRKAARLAKLAGAPADKAAGLGLCVRIGDRVRPGDVLMTVHAESPGELEYALEYFRAHPDVITLSADP
jgi:thymidine phosphorylase